MKIKTRNYFFHALLLTTVFVGKTLHAQVSALDISTAAKTNAKANTLPQIKGGLAHLRKSLDSALGEAPCLNAKLQAMMSIDESGQITAVKLSRSNTELSFRDEEVRRYLRQNTVWLPAKFQNKATAVSDFAVWIEDTSKKCLQEEKAQLEPALLQKKSSPTSINGIYLLPEVQPEFPGGTAALMRYIQKNAKGIPKCANDTIKGNVKVYTKFVIETDGSITNFELLKIPFSCAQFETDVKQLILSMPPWQPAQNNGKVVPCYFTLPIMYAR